jgi:hypothetical protein
MIGSRQADHDSKDIDEYRAVCISPHVDGAHRFSCLLTVCGARRSHNCRENAVGWNDHLDQELINSVKDLISGGFVFEGGAPFDVAKKLVTQGKESLSAEEQKVFEQELMPALRALDEVKAEQQDQHSVDDND